MDYIKRDLEQKIRSLIEDYSCILVTGPRQVGKTTLLKNLMSEEKNCQRKYVRIDDFEERKLAQYDPALFLQLHGLPIFIDEVQYAPQLFSYIKIEIDNGAPASSFWLTGSQVFKLMELTQESLAGRTAILHLSSLSQHELYGNSSSDPFMLKIDELKNRQNKGTAASVNEIYKRIWRGSLPGYLSGKFRNREVFYSSYVQTYIERDVSEMVNGVDKFIFQDFIRSAACRVGQILNVHDIAQDVGVSDDTARRWLQVLEKSGVIFYLRPYSNNLLKRTVKTPKLYFFDTGLVAYLTKYTSPEVLEAGALNGAILENYVISEIRKSYENNVTECLIWYYRDKDNREIDAVIEQDGILHPIEIKKSINPQSGMISSFSALDKGSVKRGKGAIICLRSEFSAINSDNFIVPVWMI
ncbi:MAG: ATP-binding protein [Sphaerochaetaceae bacterium]|nr:ATP-binding protein [Sphaerochaetaceae bacterium]